MTEHDPIVAAAPVEEKAAAALRAATTTSALSLAWWETCDALGHEARGRLAKLYAERLSHLAPMGRAG